MRKRRNGNMKKTWEKRRIRTHDKEKENDREKLLLLLRQSSPL